MKWLTLKERKNSLLCGCGKLWKNLDRVGNAFKGS